MKHARRLGRLTRGSASLLGIALIACTYNYDKFEHGSGGAVSGEVVSGGSTALDQGGKGPVTGSSDV